MDRDKHRREVRRTRAHRMSDTVADREESIGRVHQLNLARERARRGPFRCRARVQRSGSRRSFPASCESDPSRASSVVLLNATAIIAPAVSPEVRCIQDHFVAGDRRADGGLRFQQVIDQEIEDVELVILEKQAIRRRDSPPVCRPRRVGAALYQVVGGDWRARRGRHFEGLTSNRSPGNGKSF